MAIVRAEPKFQLGTFGFLPNFTPNTEASQAVHRLYGWRLHLI